MRHDSILSKFNTYSIETMQNGASIAVFVGPQLPCVSAGSFVQGGGRQLLAHDLVSIDRFLMMADLLGNMPQEGYAVWKRAQADLQKAATLRLAA